MNLPVSVQASLDPLASGLAAAFGRLEGLLPPISLGSPG